MDVDGLVQRWQVTESSTVFQDVPIGGVLAIDPLREFSVTCTTKTKTDDMKEHPEELGFLFLFRTNDADTASNRTYFDCAFTKFGTQKSA